MSKKNSADSVNRRDFVKAAGTTAGVTSFIPSEVLANKSPITNTRLLEVLVSYEVPDIDAAGAPAGVMLNEPRGHEIGDEQLYITKQAPKGTLSTFKNNDVVVRGERRKGQDYTSVPATVAGGDPDTLPVESLGTRPMYGIRTESVDTPTVEVKTEAASPIVTVEGERIPISSGQVTKHRLASREASIVFAHTLDEKVQLRDVEQDKWPLKREETIVTTEATPVVNVADRGKRPIIDLTDLVSRRS